tara:strand:+ start:1256 stop:1456 length:201 start_codon:yes stop_codon:yes gene_type:complete
MTTDRNERDRSTPAAALEDPLRHPGGDGVLPLLDLPLPVEKTLFQLSAELKNLIRGDRIFRAGAKR